MRSSPGHLAAALIVAACLLGLPWPFQAHAQEEPPPPTVSETSRAELGADPADEGSGALGSENEIDYSGIEEITIQGSASNTLAPDAAESAVQFDAKELDALGATDISDIAKVTPNLEITQAGATSANFFIRGVGLADYSANSATAVAIYQDGVPLNASALQLVGLFDVASVDVLRGPQGAGSGRNATAGAIKINSRKPTGEFVARLKTSLGAYQSPQALDAMIQDYEGALEMPLAGDLLSARFAFRFHAADPYMTNRCGDAPPVADRGNDAVCGEAVNRFVPRVPEGLPTAVGDQGNWAMRGLFRLQPEVMDMDWLLSVHGSKLDQQSTLGQAMGTSPTLGRGTEGGYFEKDQLDEFTALKQNFAICQISGPGPHVNQCRDLRQAALASNLVNRPLDIQPYHGDYNFVGLTSRETWGTSITGRMTLGDAGFLGPVELETTTAYDGYSRSRDTDQDFTPDVLFESQQADEGWQFFQELKARGESDDGELQWELGGYFLQENLQYESRFKTVRPQINSLRDYRQEVTSFAVYAGFGWDFLEDFSLDAGVRYNYERKRFQMNQELENFGVPVAGAQQDSLWTAPTGLLSLRYRFSDESSVYWKYSRGWKGGHYNANMLGAPPADPETVDSLEAGLRSAWLDNRIALRGAVFYYKYKNYQLFLFENSYSAPPILEIINANDAEQYGAEIELDMVPLQDWEWTPELLADLRASMRFGWLQSQFLDFVNTIEIFDATPPPAPRQQEVVYTGNQLPNAPEFKVSGTLELPLNFGRYGTLVPRYDFAWSDDIFFDANEGRGSLDALDKELPQYAIAQRSYVLHNIRLSWRDESETMEVSAWVRNIADTRYKTFAFDASIFAAVVLNFVGEPRTAGADITFRF